MRESVKDQAVADEVAAIEQNRTLTRAQSRAEIIEVIRRHYTAPAKGDDCGASMSGRYANHSEA